MKKALKALFLIGLGAAIGGLTVANKKKIKREINRLVKKGKLKAKEGEELLKEVYASARTKGKKLIKRVNSKIKNLKK